MHDMHFNITVMTPMCIFPQKRLQTLLQSSLKRWRLSHLSTGLLAFVHQVGKALDVVLPNIMPASYHFIFFDAKRSWYFIGAGGGDQGMACLYAACACALERSYYVWSVCPMANLCSGERHKPKNIATQAKTHLAKFVFRILLLI